VADSLTDLARYPLATASGAVVSCKRPIAGYSLERFAKLAYRFH